MWEEILILSKIKTQQTVKLLILLKLLIFEERLRVRFYFVHAMLDGQNIVQRARKSGRRPDNVQAHIALFQQVNPFQFAASLFRHRLKFIGRAAKNSLRDISGQPTSDEISGVVLQIDFYVQLHRIQRRPGSVARRAVQVHARILHVLDILFT